MLDQEVIANLKRKYGHLHPLLFHRSVERAKTNGDLFDILDTAPPLPVVWRQESRRWERLDDIFDEEEKKARR